jgi:hypothetical protein
MTTYLLRLSQSAMDVTHWTGEDQSEAEKDITPPRLHDKM